MLEIKCFDSSAGANFDLANFDSYCASLAQNPNRLFADYLIFSYELDGHRLKISDIWLKKIWEITCSSDAFPLKIQRKRGIIYNIRPATWYSKNPRFEPFLDWKQFVKALYETEKKYHDQLTSDNETLFQNNLLAQYDLNYE